jgi:hypothetical protein
MSNWWSGDPARARGRFLVVTLPMFVVFLVLSVLAWVGVLPWNPVWSTMATAVVLIVNVVNIVFAIRHWHDDAPVPPPHDVS